jgi:uncharacterized protein YndB with AHSA1/START domain
MTTSASTELNRIERKIVIRAPRARVWRALTTGSEFSKWFHVEMDGEFTPGAQIRMTSTYPQCAGQSFYLYVEQMTPERKFSWKWHPGMSRPGLDYSKEPMTTVEFRLEDVDGGTLLTVEESGFDRIPLSRRAGVFSENTEGWRIQMESLEEYAGKSA